MADAKLLAVVRIRSNPRTSTKNLDTLFALHLPVPNSCALVKDTPEKRGMIRKVASMVTWGEATAETVELLRKKAKDEKANWFRLNPPRKGYGRKGIKVPFVKSGGNGARGEKINDLIKRMVTE